MAENNTTVLVVEDEQMLARIISDALRQSGWEVTAVGDGVEGVEAYGRLRPAVVVADVMMPRMDGFEMARRIRAFDRDAQILFLSARSAADDVVEGFRSGGDDYLRKPFAMNELLVRVESLARRRIPGSAACEEYAVGDYTFDPNRWTLCRAGVTVKLSAREAAILSFLVRDMGRTVDMRRLLTEIWGDDGYYSLRSLNVYITRLRHRFSDDPRVGIVSERNVGYRLIVS
ncbi:MAG: response regulator transcription factor [Alistipes sp.]|nr:response regulator transcription factor [Alistipes sp.]